MPAYRRRIVFHYTRMDGLPIGAEGCAPCSQNQKAETLAYVFSISPWPRGRPQGNHCCRRYSIRCLCPGQARWRVRRSIDAPTKDLSRAQRKNFDHRSDAYAALITVDFGKADSVVVDMRYEAGATLAHGGHDRREQWNDSPALLCQGFLRLLI